MFFESYKSILYSDTLVPDIFISEYMPSMSCECVKVYLHCLFLGKHNKQASTEDLSKSLEMDLDSVKGSLTYLESLGIMSRKDDSFIINDLKEKEINKIYRKKITSTPEEALLSSERNKRRNRIISAINNNFFQGVMSPSWYTDIDAWFDRYKFDEDVMYALFQHCYDHKGLSRNYIAKVAENWYNKEIRTSFDLDRYYIEYQKVRDIRINIVKKLKRKTPLTEYEEEYVEKWVTEYNYSFEIIELALKKTTTNSSPNFEYINKVLTDWHEKGFKTREEIIEYLKRKKQAVSKKQTGDVAQHENYQQRKYDDDYFGNLYENVGNK